MPRQVTSHLSAFFNSRMAAKVGRNWQLGICYSLKTGDIK